VLILSGQGEHDWQGTAAFLRRLLVDTGRFDVRVCEAPVGLTAETLAPFDVLIDDYLGAGLGKISEEAIGAFVKSGKGLVITHNALPSFGGAVSPGDASDAFAELAHVARPAKETDRFAPFRLIPLQIARAEHPIMQGLKDSLRTGDQLYQKLAVQPPAEILAKSDTGEPLLFVASHGKGRVFCSALGHDLAAMQEKVFTTTFLRGTEWAASAAVTLPPEIGLPGPKEGGLRVLVITGGHDHEASFYGLFDGYQDIGWVPVTNSQLAFQNDLRPKYDVLVMYDFTRDMGEKERKNLQDFVESGKGVVVLHHGVLNYQKWPWWYEEVVGGRYRLEQEGGIPNSTVKMNQEHLITPVAGHPITTGIGPFHVTDETYRGLYISPNIKPLLTTDNRNSDPVVGWIGPCTTSKVVYIQLGHDHSPFRHPSYRALVHNSILWSAGKL
jgi:type 1 glutamine amidotransferase